MHKRFLIIAAVTGALAVLLGAFGAHSLKKILEPEALNTFETGVRYQFYHTFALMIVALLCRQVSNRWLNRAGYFFLTGIILFSGSLYVLTILNATQTVGLSGVGILTPIGGLFFIAGWLCLIPSSSVARDSL